MEEAVEISATSDSFKGTIHREARASVCGGKWHDTMVLVPETPLTKPLRFGSKLEINGNTYIVIEAGDDPHQPSFEIMKLRRRRGARRLRKG